MRHFLNNLGYGGYCDPEVSPAISPEQLIPEEDTVLIDKSGAIKVVKRGTTVAGFSDVEHKDYSPASAPDGSGGWVEPEPIKQPISASVVPAWAAKVATDEVGLTAKINTLASSLAARGDYTLLRKWQGAATFKSDDATLTRAVEELGLPDDSLRKLFERAAEIASV